MITSLIIYGVFSLIDFVLLALMPKFYLGIGIPFYKGSFILKEDRTLEDIGDFIEKGTEYIYKICDNKLFFRTEFTYSLFLREILILSIIKGDIKIKANKGYIVQRINLTTLYTALLLLYIFITYNVHFVGYILLVVGIFGVIFLHRARYTQIDEIRKMAQVYVNQDRVISSRRFKD
jgi:hypothetical protein